MKAFSLFKSRRGLSGSMKKESIWTEVLKKDLVTILDEIENRAKGGKYEVTRINESTLYIHRNYYREGLEGVCDIIYTIEEATF